MIQTFRNKALADLWASGKTAKIDAKLHDRILRRLDRLDAAAAPDEMNVPGFDVHRRRGFKPSYTIPVNGPCITFEFNGENAARVDLEQYH